MRKKDSDSPKINYEVVGWGGVGNPPQLFNCQLRSSILNKSVFGLVFSTSVENLEAS